MCYNGIPNIENVNRSICQHLDWVCHKAQHWDLSCLYFQSTVIGIVNDNVFLNLFDVQE